MPKVHASYPIWPPCDKGECGQRPKTVKKKCMKLNWYFQRGGWGLRKTPFHVGGMESFLELHFEARGNFTPIDWTQ